MRNVARRQAPLLGRKRGGAAWRWYEHDQAQSRPCRRTADLFVPDDPVRRSLRRSHNGFGELRCLWPPLSRIHAMPSIAVSMPRSAHLLWRAMHRPEQRLSSLRRMWRRLPVRTAMRGGTLRRLSVSSLWDVREPMCRPALRLRELRRLRQSLWCPSIADVPRRIRMFGWNLHVPGPYQILPKHPVCRRHG